MFLDDFWSGEEQVAGGLVRYETVSDGPALPRRQQLYLLHLIDQTGKYMSALLVRASAILRFGPQSHIRSK